MPSDPSDPAPGTPDAPDVDALAEQLAAEMRRRWERGERPLAEDFVAAHPALQDHPGAVGELVYEEVCLRRERWGPGASSEVCRRFPRWTAQLRMLLALRDVLGPEGEPDFPEAGERLGEFHLLVELGRGRRGRVYLARQPALADRPVVVKLTPRSDAEHRTLARLQHTHIVPLYAAHDDPARRLRVLCMPFFGGATLAHALDQLRPLAPADRTAADLWAAVASGPGNDTLAASPTRPARGADTDYVREVCRIGAGLADGLHFAHERGLVHMDVKPANILLTAEGQPMLLDLHLAQEPVPAGGPGPPWLGGTPGYQAPEQQAALDAVRAGGPVPAPVTGRTDVFALGVVLYEALAGRLPRTEPRRPLRRLNRRVSPGLSDLVSRCLAADARDRYPDAAAAADDLRRHLADLPLRGVRNRSLPERWRKWRRRRPHTLVLGGVLVLLLAAVGLSAGYVVHRRAAARAALDEGNAELDRGRFTAARGAFRRGLAVTEDLPARGDLAGDLDRGLRRAERGEAVADLHAAADGLRGVYAADTLAPDDLAAAGQFGERLWARRAALFGLLADDQPVREQVRADLTDLVLLCSHVRVRLAPPGGEGDARREALDMLAEAERALGPNPALLLERAENARALGRGDDAAALTRQAERTPPRSAAEHFAVGYHHVRRGDPARAWAPFALAVDLDPHSFWAQFHLGRAALALDRRADAVAALSACVALEPTNPLGRLHRGLAHLRGGDREPALRDLNRALALDPGNAQARTLREAAVRLP